jgi:ring-1,2-phenylacetyl-CoA epoxidase subunit PaaC
MATTSFRFEETPRIRQLLSLADDALILGHRIGEWTGHAPILEEELALANIALDLIGLARSLYQATGLDEDALAYLRDPAQFRNAAIVELPNGDFAFTIARLFFVSVASDLFWRATALDGDALLAAIAAKAEKETAYHVRHSAEWLIRLGDGTAESHRRAQDAVDGLWSYTGEISRDRDAWAAIVDPLLTRATLTRPADGWMQGGARSGGHTEHLGHLLAEMQSLPRSFPGAKW